MTPSETKRRKAGFSLHSLVYLATCVSKKGEDSCRDIGLSGFADADFFEKLMASLLSLSQTYSDESERPRKTEKMVRAILHILHQLYICKGFPVPRELSTAESKLVLFLCFGKLGSVELSSDRICIRAQICCKSLLRPESINSLFFEFPGFEDDFCTCIVLKRHSMEQIKFFSWLLTILVYPMCFKPLQLLYSNLASFYEWDRPEMAIFLSSFAKLAAKASPHNYHDIEAIFILACRALSSNVLPPKTVCDCLNIAESWFRPVICSSRSNEAIFVGSVAASCKTALSHAESARRYARMLSYLVRHSTKYLSSLRKEILVLFQHAVGDSSLFLYSVATLKVARKHSLELYRQLWQENGLLFLIKQYSHRHLLAIFDLLCPLFMFAGGIEWILVHKTKLHEMLRDVIDLCFFSLYPNVYVEDSLQTHKCQTASLVAIDFFMGFFGLGGRKPDWVDFCVRSFKNGQVLCCVASIYFRLGCGPCHLPTLLSYFQRENLQLYLLWPIVMELRSFFQVSSHEILSCSLLFQHYIHFIEDKFAPFPSISALDSEDDFEHRFMQLSLKLSQKVLSDLLSDENTHFHFKGTLRQNSSVFCNLRHLSSDSEALHIVETWALSTLQHLFENELFFNSESLFIRFLDTEECVFCAIASLIHLCCFLDVSGPVPFFWRCLRRCIKLSLSRPDTRHQLSECLSRLLMLACYTTDFRKTLSYLVFAARSNEIRTSCYNLLVRLARDN